MALAVILAKCYFAHIKSCMCVCGFVYDDDDTKETGGEERNAEGVAFVYCVLVVVGYIASSYSHIVCIMSMSCCFV